MRWLISVLATVLAAAFVSLAGIGGWLYWNRVETNAAQEARAELPAIAEDQMTNFFDYDYQTVERSLMDVYDLLTPEYRKEFQEKANSEIIPETREREVVSQATIVGVGVLDAHRDSASVMVYLNRTLTDKSKQPLYDGSRLRVDYQRINGDWKINYIQPI